MMSRVWVGAVLSVAACGGAAPELEGLAAPSVPAVSVPDPAKIDLCKRIFARQGECSAEFMPMLLDARIRADMPAGIAAKAGAPGGRDALLAEGLTELKHDSSEPGVSELCIQVAASAQGDGTAQAACLTQADCAGFAACMMPGIEKGLAGAK